jgi:hypothetical protein
MIKYFWRVLLRLNNVLRKRTNNEYQAHVVTSGKRALSNSDIAHIIVKSGSELKHSTLLSAFDQYDSIVREYLQQGYCIRNGYCRISPKVLGTWSSAIDRYNPDVHKVTVEMAPSAELCEALEAVSVVVLGMKSPVAVIGLVTDGFTGEKSGNITPDDLRIIEGEKLKIAPEIEIKTATDDEQNLGVFFIDAEGIATPAKRLIQNYPKHLVVRTPNLTSGKYTLRIVTRYSKSGTLLQDPRIIEYGRPLTVL